jgi:flagellar biogenesis protein FliO
MVPLGDKRFVAVLDFEDQRYLIGGASGSVSLLTALPESKEFAGMVGRCVQQQESRAN